VGSASNLSILEKPNPAVIGRSRVERKLVNYSLQQPAAVSKWFNNGYMTPEIPHYEIMGKIDLFKYSSRRDPFKIHCLIWSDSIDDTY
jgi:hypothetical protein